MRVHTQEGKNKHFAIMAEKVICPVCKAGYSHKCVATKRPFTNLPANTVHIERVREMNCGTTLKVM